MNVQCKNERFDDKPIKGKATNKVDSVLDVIPEVDETERIEFIVNTKPELPKVKQEVPVISIDTFGVKDGQILTEAEYAAYDKPEKKKKKKSKSIHKVRLVNEKGEKKPKQEFDFIFHLYQQMKELAENDKLNGLNDDSENDEGCIETSAEISSIGMNATRSSKESTILQFGPAYKDRKQSTLNYTREDYKRFFDEYNSDAYKDHVSELAPAPNYDSGYESDVGSEPQPQGLNEFYKERDFGDIDVENLLKIDFSVGEDGQISQELVNVIINVASSSRPFAQVKFSGTSVFSVALIDTGSSLDIVNTHTKNLIETELEENGKSLVNIDYRSIGKAFGGASIPLNSVTLLSFEMGGVQFNNLPFMTSSFAYSTFAPLLLGCPFLRATASSVEFHRNATYLTFRDPQIDMEKIKLALKSHVPQPLICKVDTMIPPKERRDLELYFKEGTGFRNNFDDNPVYITELDDYPKCQRSLKDLKWSRVQRPSKGMFKVSMYNDTQDPIYIADNVPIAQGDLLGESMDAMPLASIGQFFKVMGENDNKLKSCLCTVDLYKNKSPVMIVPLNSAQFSLLGFNLEYLFDNEADQSEHGGIIIQGSTIYIKCGLDGRHLVTEDGVNSILELFDPKEWQIIVPYVYLTIMSTPLMTLMNELRQNQFMVTATSFDPHGGAENLQCKTCQKKLPNLGSLEKCYKKTKASIIIAGDWGLAYGTKQERQILDGTEVQEWNIGDWKIYYWENTRNSWVFHIHWNKHSAKSSRFEANWSILFAYLRPLILNSEINIAIAPGGHIEAKTKLKIEEQFEKCINYPEYEDVKESKARTLDDSKASFHFVDQKEFSCNRDDCLWREGKSQGNEISEDPPTSIICQKWPRRSQIQEWEILQRTLMRERGADDSGSVSSYGVGSVGVDKYDTFDTFAFVGALANYKTSTMRHENKEKLSKVNKTPLVSKSETLGVRDVWPHQEIPILPHKEDQHTDIERTEDHVDLSHLTEAQQKVAHTILNRYKDRLLTISKEDSRIIKNWRLALPLKNTDISHYGKFPVKKDMEWIHDFHYEALIRKGHVHNLGNTKLLPSNLHIKIFSAGFLVHKSASVKYKSPKEPQDFRCVFDLTYLNQVLDDDIGTSVSGINSKLNSLAGAKYATTADAHNFFNSLPLASSSLPYCGFTLSTHLGIFLTCLLGVCCFPGAVSQINETHFYELMHKWLSSHVDDHVLVTYNETMTHKERFPIDDDLIDLLDPEIGLEEEFLEHMSLLNKFLSLADSLGLMLHVSKLRIAVDDVEILGVKVKKGMIQTQERKLDHLTEMDFATFTRTDLKHFLGFCGFLSSSIEMYQGLAYILNRKVASDEPDKDFKMQPLEIKLCEMIRSRLQSQLPRHLFDNSLPTIIYLDSSITSCGVVVLTRAKDQRLQIVAFHSWTLPPSMIKDTSLAKETAGLVMLIRKFPMYFTGTELTTVYSDCRLLFEAFSKKAASNTEAKYSRWCSLLKATGVQFKLLWKERSARFSSLADILSKQNPTTFHFYTSPLSSKLKDVDPNLKPDFDEALVRHDEIEEFLIKHGIIEGVTEENDCVGNEVDDFIDGLLPSLTYPMGRQRFDRMDKEVMIDDMISEPDEKEVMTVFEADDDKSGEVFFNGTKLMQLDSIDMAQDIVSKFDEKPTNFHDLLNLREQMVGAQGNAFSFLGLIQEQKLDAKFGPIIEKLLTGTAKPSIKKRYKMVQNSILTTHDNKICISFRHALLISAFSHLSSFHSGSKTLYKCLSKHYDSSYLKTACSILVKSCVHCQLCRPINFKDEDQGRCFRPTRPFAGLHVDFAVMDTTEKIKGRKVKNIFVALDGCSRYQWTIPTATQTAETVIECLSSVFKTMPKNATNYVMSDNASGIVRSKAVLKYLTDKGIKIKHILANNSRSASLVERSIRSLRESLRICQSYSQKKSWVQNLDIATSMSNAIPRQRAMLDENGKKKFTFMSPNEMHFGRSFHCPLDDLLANELEDQDQVHRWRDEVLRSMQRFEDEAVKEHKKKDEKPWGDAQLVDGDLCLMKSLDPGRKNSTIYIRNLFVVIARHKATPRLVLISNLYGRKRVLYRLHIRFLKKITISNSLQYLPVGIRGLLGQDVSQDDLNPTAQDFLPLTIRESIRKEVKKKRKKKKDETDTESSSDGDEPFYDDDVEWELFPRDQLSRPNEIEPSEMQTQIEIIDEDFDEDLVINEPEEEIVVADDEAEDDADETVAVNKDNNNVLKKPLPVVQQSRYNLRSRKKKKKKSK